MVKIVQKCFWKNDSRCVFLSFSILWINSCFVLTNSQHVDQWGNKYTDVGSFRFYLDDHLRNFAEAYEDCRKRLHGYLGVPREHYISTHLKNWFKNVLKPSKYQVNLIRNKLMLWIRSTVAKSWH